MKYYILFIVALCAILYGTVLYLPSDYPTLGRISIGTANPDVTQANIKSTICVSGFTATIRPPTSYTSPLKAKLCKQQNCGDSSKYELDHRIALTVGGAPSDPNNLWLQPYPDAKLKDRLEVVLNKKVCNYELTLAQAQAMLKGNWQQYFQEYIGSKFGGTVYEEDQDDI